jgi:hypothetical protein
MPRPKDETYVIDLCDDVLGATAVRGHRFAFLRGDPDKRGIRHCLPVDAFYPTLNLVIEYHERQHSEPVKFFDRRIVANGMTRGKQRMLYDRRRLRVLRTRGIKVLVLSYKDFVHRASKRLFRVPADRDVVAKRLADFLGLPSG